MKVIRSKKGFSLVELLVVISIISIMAAIGLPSLIGMMGHIRLMRATRDIAVVLQAARLKAIAKNFRYEVSFTQGAADSYRLQYWDRATAAWKNDDASEYGGGKTLSNTLNIQAPAGNFQVIFFPAGTATNDSGTTANQRICLVNTGSTSDKWSIVITAATGKVMVISGCTAG